MLLASNLSVKSSFYSLSRDGDSGTLGRHVRVTSDAQVSIRCREMGTAEPVGIDVDWSPMWPFLFAVARWGQRNCPRYERCTRHD